MYGIEGILPLSAAMAIAVLQTAGMAADEQAV